MSLAVYLLLPSQRITGEKTFISANFDENVSCSSIFMFKGIVYDVVHRRLQ